MRANVTPNIFDDTFVGQVRTCPAILDQFLTVTANGGGAFDRAQDRDINGVIAVSGQRDAGSGSDTGAAGRRHYAIGTPGATGAGRVAGRHQLKH